MNETIFENNLSNFIGQEKIIVDLKKRIDFSKNNNLPLPHILLSGQPEIGKATLAHLITKETGRQMKITSGSAIEKVGDLASILTNLIPGEILFIDEISNLNKIVEKIFQQALGTGTMDVIIGKGPNARTVNIELPPFTVIATTSKSWSVDEKIRRWFVVYDFTSYSLENIKDILKRIALENGFGFSDESALILAKYCNGLPGNIPVMIKRISSYVKSMIPTAYIDNSHISEIINHLGFGENYPQSLTLVDKFSHMTGIQFEEWVANYFRKTGYEARITKTSGDHGIDLLLYKEGVLVGAVQCKCWNGSVGEPVVREFYGSLMNTKAPEGYLFITAEFTAQAKTFAQDKPIKLIDLENLIKLAE